MQMCDLLLRFVNARKVEFRYGALLLAIFVVVAAMQVVSPDLRAASEPLDPSEEYQRNAPYTFWEVIHSKLESHNVVEDDETAVYFAAETAHFEASGTTNRLGETPHAALYIYLYNEQEGWHGPHRSDEDCNRHSWNSWSRVKCRWSVTLPDDLVDGDYWVMWNVRYGTNPPPRTASWGAPLSDHLYSIAYRYWSSTLYIRVVDQPKLQASYVPDVELTSDQMDCGQHILAGAWQEDAGGTYGMTTSDIACRGVAGAIGEVFFIADARAVVDCFGGECTLVALGGIAAEAVTRKAGALWRGAKKLFKIGGEPKSAFSDLAGKGYRSQRFDSLSHSIRSVSDLKKTALYKAYDGDAGVQAGLRKLADGARRTCIGKGNEFWYSSTKDKCIGYLRELQAATDFQRAGKTITGIQVPSSIPLKPGKIADFTVRNPSGTECLAEVRSASNVQPSYRSELSAAARAKGLGCSMLYIAKAISTGSNISGVNDVSFDGGWKMLMSWWKKDGARGRQLEIVVRTDGGFVDLKAGSVQ